MDYPENSAGEEPPAQTEPSSPRRSTKSERVFLRYFRHAQPLLLKTFEEVTLGQETAFYRIAPDMFDKMCKLCKVLLGKQERDEARDKFTEIGEDRLGDASEKVDFESVCGVITTWFQRTKPPLAIPAKRSPAVNPPPNVHNSSSFFESKLCRAILEFEALIKQTPKESLYINRILDVMKEQLSQFKHERVRQLQLSEVSQSATKEENDGIVAIYRWYAQQHQNTLHRPTFEELRSQKETMDHGTFCRFAADFKIMRLSARDKARVLTRNQLITIFKKHSSYNKDMSQGQFIESLDSVADLYYNEKWEELNEGTSVSDRTIEQKRMMLYQHLQAGDPKYFAKVRRQFGNAFRSTVDTGARLIREEHYNLKYNPHKSEAMLASIEEFKQKKHDLKRLEAERAAVEEKERAIRAKKLAQEQKADRDERRKQMEDKRRKQAEMKKVAEEKEAAQTQTVVKVHEITEISYSDLKGKEEELNQLIKVEESDEDEDEDFYETYVRTLSCSDVNPE